MAHFAELDENNVVLRVVVVNNDAIGNLSFPESEQPGVDFCKSLFGENTIWKQTSYNNNFRKNYAVTGGTYIPESDGFAGLKPEFITSFVLDRELCAWVPPVPIPNKEDVFSWHEPSLSWQLVPQPYPSWSKTYILGWPFLIWKAPIDHPSDNKIYIWNESTQSWDEKVQ